jgi:4'-phosphopantetheinyl transferase
MEAWITGPSPVMTMLDLKTRSSMIEWLDSLRAARDLPAAWLLDLTKAELRRAALALAPTPDDRKRAASRPPAERENVLVRRGLARLCIAATLGVPAAKVRVGRTAKGAPFLLPPFGLFRLSVAHRENRFACALAFHSIGIDIEIADGGENPWKVLHPDEAAMLREAPACEGERLFLQVWAAKEAYAKALGEGLAREPSGFAVRLPAPSGPFRENVKASRAYGCIDDPARQGRPIEVHFSPIGKDEGIAAMVLLRD